MENRSIVVCGATGSQGGSVLRSLLAGGHGDLVAVSRRPDGDAARALERAGVRVVRGDLLDPMSLEASFQGAHGVFGVTQPWSPDYRSCDVAAEVRQGRSIVDAVRRAGVSHLVLSTVLLPGTGRTGVPHVDSKLEIEDYARDQGVPVTILRPGSFMDNIGSPHFPVGKRSVRGFVAGDAKVPFVATADIGVVAAAVFARTAEYVGREVGVVGELASGEDLAATLTRLRGGARVRYSAIPGFMMKIFAPEFYAMRRLFERYGRPPIPSSYQAALDETRQLCPEPTTLERHLRARGYDRSDSS